MIDFLYISLVIDENDFTSMDMVKCPWSYEGHIAWRSFAIPGQTFQVFIQCNTRERITHVIHMWICAVSCMLHLYLIHGIIYICRIHIMYLCHRSRSKGVIIIIVSVSGITVLCHFRKIDLMPLTICKNDKLLVALYNVIFSNMTGNLSHLSYIIY